MDVSPRELTRELGISSPTAGYCVERGEGVARENNYSLTGWFLLLYLRAQIIYFPHGNSRQR